jgi:starvation-inducible DNA-binding protein
LQTRSATAAICASPSPSTFERSEEDPLPERVRAAGNTTIRSLGQAARLRTIADNEAEDVASDAMLAELMEDNKALAASMRQAHKPCDELEDVATASLLDGYIDEAENRPWFLREAARRP